MKPFPVNSLVMNVVYNTHACTVTYESYKIYNATPNIAITSALATILPSLTFTSIDLYHTKVTHTLTYAWQHLGTSRSQLLHCYIVVSAVVEENPLSRPVPEPVFSQSYRCMDIVLVNLY